MNHISLYVNTHIHTHIQSFFCTILEADEEPFCPQTFIHYNKSNI